MAFAIHFFSYLAHSQLLAGAKTIKTGRVRPHSNPLHAPRPTRLQPVRRRGEGDREEGSMLKEKGWWDYHTQGGHTRLLHMETNLEVAT